MAAPSLETIGLIGVGLLGTALAERLRSSGFSLLGWDREESRRASLPDLGAERASNATMIASRCTRIVLSLPDSKVVGAVLSEISGAFLSGSIVIDTSTGEPADAVRFAESLAKKGVTYLDATVSGSSTQVRQGETLCMVGGDREAFVRCADLWTAWGGHTLHAGANGDGARLKLVTNLVLGINRAALAEGLALAETMGLDPALTLEALREGAAYSRIMDSKGQKMILGDFTPQARLSQHLKDVRLILKSAAESGMTLPLSETHRQLLEQAETMGLGGLDNSAIIQVLKKPQA